MNGFLVLDKPGGVTSFDVVAQVRRALGVKRVGHLGTLDPLATGVLVVAVGEGTKLVEYLMGADKVYEVELKFGKVSDTYDREGRVEEVTGVRSVSRDEIEKVVVDFVGAIEQVPPVYSALKIEGKRSYELARKGIPVEMKSRTVHIHSIDLLSYEWPHLKLRVHCGSGTYIRSLVHDLGQKLGCGALMTELRRTQVGPFELHHALPAQEVSATELIDHMIPLEEVVRDWPSISLSDLEVQKLKNGQAIVKPHDFPSLKSNFPVVGFHHKKLVSLLQVAPDGRVRALKNMVVL